MNAVSVDLARMRLRRPRRFGDCWLGLMLWRELGLEGFWGRALSRDRGAVDWSKVLAVLAINRLCEPAREGQALYVLAQSEDRRKKENAIRRRKLKTLIHGLNRLKRTCWDRDRLIGKVAVLRKEAGRAAWFVRLRKPRSDEPVNRETFVGTFDRAAWREALRRDGSYILRAWIPWEDWPKDIQRQAPTLWAWYMQLVQVEEAFRILKSDLDLRPIFHQVEPRVEAHILVAFLGYCLSATLRARLRASAPGLTARETLASLSAIQMLDVELPTTDGRVPVLPRYSEPEAEQEILLEKLGLSLPAQPPPRIRAGQLTEPTDDGAPPAGAPAVL